MGVIMYFFRNGITKNNNNMSYISTGAHSTSFVEVVTRVVVVVPV